MLKIDNKSLESIAQECSKTLVGEICKLIEEIEKSESNISNPFALLKTLIKNKIYENGRFRTTLEKKFSEGMTCFEVQFAKSTPKE